MLAKQWIVRRVSVNVIQSFGQVTHTCMYVKSSMYLGILRRWLLPPKFNVTLHSRKCKNAAHLKVAITFLFVFFFIFLAFWPLLWYRTVKYQQEVKWTGSGKVSESGLKLRKPETQLRYMLTCCPRGYCRRLFMFSFLNIFGWGWTLNMQTNKFVHVYFCYGYAFLQMHFCISYQFCSCRVDLWILNKGNGMFLHSLLFI